eukprot:TRINITY_DN63820_c0_g1_i1.p1 TRINITY_DN63820_c0_g1~~TRINITY_DN63820_c0_g1_i1.p1  ORF type:complete len:355 (-),score=109.99 TRINITY_DN63820_c0_g1_i1:87-1034(-)
MAGRKPAKSQKKQTKEVEREVEEAIAEEVEEDDENEPEGSDDSEGEEAAPQAAAAKKKGKAPKSKANRLQEMEENGEQEPRGVVYLGHIPAGFYEPQMKTFFSQFGKVTRLRISRSKKSGQSKGYAFIEFEEEAVANIVAETMHKYLLFEKQLVCHIVPPEKQHAALFKNWKKGMKNWTNQRRRKAAASHNDRPKITVNGEEVPEITLKQVARRNNKEKKLRSVLEQLEIDFPVLEASEGKKRKTFHAKAGKKEQAPAGLGSKRKAEAAIAEPVAKRRPDSPRTAPANAAPGAASKGKKAVPKKAIAKKSARSKA